jgi:hypothetical protein
MSAQKFTKRRTWILIAALVILLGLLVWGISWATYARPPLPEALEALKGDDQVLVSSDPWLNFTPTEEEPAIGFIFYPGGRIDPRGYAPLLKAISAEGYLVVVPKMPINMAIFNPNIADKIIEHYNKIDHWVIGGHSVGGVSAAIFASRDLRRVDGLVMWASYPIDNSVLYEADLPTVSIYGELDPAANREIIQEKKYLLPPGTEYVEIKGGDHHQFGSYQIKPEESIAVIPPAEQQEGIIQATLHLLDRVKVHQGIK